MFVLFDVGFTLIVCLDFNIDAEKSATRYFYFQLFHMKVAALNALKIAREVGVLIINPVVTLDWGGNSTVVKCPPPNWKVGCSIRSH